MKTADKTNSHPEPGTWAELIAIEPQLVEIERFVRSLPEPREYRDWEAVKSQFDHLVGWNAERPELRNHRAHHLVYSHLLKIFEAAAPSPGSNGSDCTFCQVEPVEFFRVPTKLGTLADLCHDCARREFRR